MVSRDIIKKQIEEAKQKVRDLESQLTTAPHVSVIHESFDSGELVVDIGRCFGYPTSVRLTTNGGTETYAVFVRRN